MLLSTVTVFFNPPFWKEVIEPNRAVLGAPPLGAAVGAGGGAGGPLGGAGGAIGGAGGAIGGAIGGAGGAVGGAIGGAIGGAGGAGFVADFPLVSLFEFGIEIASSNTFAW